MGWLSRLKQSPGFQHPQATSASLWRLALVFLLIVIFQAIMAQFDLVQWVEQLERKTYDLRVSILQNNPKIRPSPDIVLVDFDDTTFFSYQDELAEWPWPREIHAQMMDTLTQMGVRVVAYDFVFENIYHKESPGNDQLVSAYLRHPNVVTSLRLDNFGQSMMFLLDNYPQKKLNLLQKVGVPFVNVVSLPGNSISTLFRKATFNNWTMILEGFFKAPKRIGVVNHIRDADGMSRSTPLLFQLDYLTPQQIQRHMILPHLSLRILSVLDELSLSKADAKQSQNPKLKLTASGLTVLGRTIPLHPGSAHYPGQYFIIWYPAPFLPHTVTYWKSHGRLSAEGAERYRWLESRPWVNHFTYPMIPAWRFMQYHHRAATHGLLDEDLKLARFMRGKIVFVGSTAKINQDFKSTPVGPHFPGLVMQATVFDNLYQNQGFIHRSSSTTVAWVILVLVFAVVSSLISIRSIPMVAIFNLTLGTFYAALSIFLFTHYFYWLDMVLPLLVVLAVTLIGFGLKFFYQQWDYEKTYRLANQDNLSGLYNRRYLQTEIARWIKDHKAGSQSLFSLLIIDIDYFKKINDAYGHGIGDQVIQHVANRLKALVRSNDLVVRYGGEEFVVALKDVGRGNAIEIGQKIIHSLEMTPFLLPTGGDLDVTASLGLASFPDDAKTLETLLDIADQGLYRAKSNGRNQIDPLLLS